MTPARRNERSLWPKEHGAYGQLGLPLVTALAAARPGISAVCLVVASIAVFAAHEPALVLLGVRGEWAKRQHGARARRAALAWAAVACACGAAGVWLGGETVLRAALLPIVLVAVLAPFVARGSEKTLAGEVVAALALAAAAFPVAMAGGLAFEASVTLWGIWALAFVASTAAVHRVIAAHKGRGNHASLLVAISATAVAATFTKQSMLFVAVLPMLTLSWVLIVRPPNARHLKRIGWSLATSGLLTGALFIVLLRALVGV